MGTSEMLTPAEVFLNGQRLDDLGGAVLLRAGANALLVRYDLETGAAKVLATLPSWQLMHILVGPAPNVVVLVGSDPSSRIYVRNKRRACEESGIVSIAHDLPQRTTQKKLLALGLAFAIWVAVTGENRVVHDARIALEVVLRDDCILSRLPPTSPSSRPSPCSSASRRAASTRGRSATRPCTAGWRRSSPPCLPRPRWLRIDWPDRSPGNRRPRGRSFCRSR